MPSSGFQPSIDMDKKTQLDLIAKKKLLLKQLDARYNPILKLVSVSYAPHSFLTAMRGWPLHSTRGSLQYALALLCMDCEKMQSRAENIIRRVIGLQIQKSGHSYYGNWPKYWEEHLIGIYRIDENWANFISTYLIEILILHQQKVSLKLKKIIETAVFRAIYHIQKRDLALEYTNIVVSTIYVNLVFGEITENDDFIDYGLTLLKTFHRHTISQKSFSEYNSPNYQVVTLKSLARLRRDVKNLDAQLNIRELYYLAWQNIAEHFHPPTSQWSGPHTRSYSTLMKTKVLSLIDRSTTTEVDFAIPLLAPPLEESLLSCSCPPDLEHFFISLNKPRHVVHTLSCGQRFTTYLNPEFSLGSISYSDFWHQRNVLIAYWGTPKRPCYLRMRFLYGGKDFAAAHFSSVQEDNKILAGVSLSTDIDILNPYQSRCRINNKKLPLRDLRMRFEFGGEAQVEDYTLREDYSFPIILTSEGFSFKFSVPYACFGSDHKSDRPHWKMTKTTTGNCLDLVLCNTSRSSLLSDLSEAVVAIAFEISKDETEISDLSIADSDDESIKMDWDGMSLELWKKPAPKQFFLDRKPHSK